jgi:hypothetical protein
MNETDELDLLSAIWIMASNDENHLITYQGIIHRLKPPEGFDTRASVARRPELFRPGANKSDLDDWKQRLLAGKDLPSWIRDLPDGSKRQERIDALSVSDVFRSQFRTARNAPQSPLGIIEWGLGHIDRIRAAQLARKPDWIKRGTILIALLTVACSVGVAILNYRTTVSAQAKAQLQSEENIRRAVLKARLDPLRAFCVSFMSEPSRQALTGLAPGKDEFFAQQIVDNKLEEWRVSLAGAIAGDQALSNAFEAYCDSATRVAERFAKPGPTGKDNDRLDAEPWKKLRDAGAILISAIDRVCG